MTMQSGNNEWFVRLRIVLGIVIVSAGCFGSSASVADETRKFIMIGIGDSYSSGQGAPNAPADATHPAQWNNQNTPHCFRSDNAPAIVAFKALKAAHNNVAFADDHPNV